MRNPRLIFLGFLFAFALSAALYFAPDTVRAKTDWLRIDKFVHFFSGYLIAAACAFLFRMRHPILLMGMAFAVGAAWEVFECFVDPWLLYFYNEPLSLSRFDTYTDVLMVILGGLVYWLIHLRRRTA